MPDHRTIAGSQFGDSAQIHLGDNNYNCSHDDKKRCLLDLRVTDPKLDKARIVQAKGGLREESYCWIFENEDFKQWKDTESDSRFLWIKGNPGKGKTMLLAGIIDKLNTEPGNFGQIAYMESNCNETFLWVALACQLIEDPKLPGWEILVKLRKTPAGLENIYRRMLDYTLGSHCKEDCKQILKLTLTAYRPMTLDELLSLWEPSEDTPFDKHILQEIVERAGSFLTLKDDTIYFIHQSAKDYLIVEATEELDFVRHLQHYHTFNRCLIALNRNLRRNIYSLGYPGFPIEEVRIPEPDPLAPVRYCCIYWASHLCDSDPDSLRMALGPGGVLKFFLREKSLNWIEAMCLLQVLPDALRVLYKLRQLATSTEPRVHSSSQETRRGAQDLIHNIFRIMCYFRIGIEVAPLQIYASGLTSCPEIFLESMSKKRSDAQDEVYTWKTSSLNLPSHWSSLTQTFSFPVDRFSNVYLAPTQDDFIISSCRRDTLVLQRTNNAAPAELLSHACDVVLGAYSTDHTRLACLSSEGKIAIWDMEREQVLKKLDVNVHGFPKPEKLDKGALAFTSDISTLLLAYHGRIGMWNIDRESFSQPFDIGSYSVTKCHVFGREGTLLATVETGVVEIWNLGDNHMIQQYTHQNLVKVTHRIPIAFSHDGNKFVVIEVGRVVVHDLEDGKDLCIDTDAMGFKTCIAAPVFTRTGNIGVPCKNGIHLLAANGAHLGTFDVKAHGGFCFSADELQIAAVVSQSFSACEIGIWDADLLPTKTDEDVEQWDYTPDCFISRNGCQLALVSPDKISIWNTQSGLLEKSFKTHGLLSVRFSEDFRWFAWKGHGDNVLRFWDTLKDEMVMEINLSASLRLHKQVFFSHPDLNLVAIWSLNGEITIWDLLS